jgi:hypothetical protein
MVTRPLLGSDRAGSHPHHSVSDTLTIIYSNPVHTWLGNVSANTTRKMVSQLKSISHILNFIVYSYMIRSSWDHHQAVYIINTIKLIEISIWIHIVVQRVPIRKVLKVVENCALCYDENYNIKTLEILRIYKICI